MIKSKKVRKIKHKAAVEEAAERIVALMEDSARSLPEPQRASMLEKIREIAAATVAESRAEAAERTEGAGVSGSRGASGRRKKG